MDFQTAIGQPQGKLIILTELTPGVWVQAWISAGSDSFKAPFTYTPSKVLWNGTTELTLRLSSGSVNSNPSSYYFDGTYLYVRPPSGSIYAGTVQAIVPIRVSNHPVNVSSKLYDPRIKSAPNLSQRIEGRFGGVAQIGGGSLSLINSDGYFEDKASWQWDAGTVTIKLGLMMPGVALADVTFDQVAVWAVEDWTKNRDDFVLKLTETKSRIKTQLPLETYTRDDFSNIDNSEIGKPIPLCYGDLFGVKATCVNPGSRQFRVCNHEIFAINEVRIKQEIDEFFEVYFDTAWLLWQGTTYRLYLPSAEILKVTNSTGPTVFTNTANFDEVLTTANSWAYNDSFVYANFNGAPRGTLVEYQKKNFRWTVTAPSSVDLSVGGFILGIDWHIGQEVAVDLIGKPGADGLPMTTGPDIILDLLETAGETEIDSAAFTAAREEYISGLDESGLEVCRMCMSAHVVEKTDLLKLIGDINKAGHSFVFTNSDGEFSIGVFRPQQTPLTYDLTDLDLVEMSELTDNDDLKSVVITRYALHESEEYSQEYTHSRPEARTLHAQPEDTILDEVLPFSEAEDAELYTQRTSFMRSRPLKRFSITLHWKGWRFTVGDQLSVRFARRGITGKFEVLEVMANVVTSQIKLTVGDLRGFGDRVGFWVDDSDVLPAAFAGLAGYGSGSLVWNAAWDAQIKAWARANVGYWTDANGLADPTDPDSFIPSSWF